MRLSTTSKQDTTIEYINNSTYNEVEHVSPLVLDQTKV